MNRTTLLQNASPAARRAKRSHPIARREGVGSLLASVAHFGDGCCVRFRGARAGTRAWSGSAREACAAAMGWGAGLAKAVPQSHVFKSSSAASARAAAAQVSRSDKGHQASQPKVHVYSRSFRRPPLSSGHDLSVGEPLRTRHLRPVAARRASKRRLWFP